MAGKISKKEIQNLLRLARLRFEKCEINEAKTAYSSALKLAENQGDPLLLSEAVAGLLRYAVETGDSKGVIRLERHLETLEKRSKALPAQAYYCIGLVRMERGEVMAARSAFLMALRTVSDESLRARIWFGLAQVALKTGKKIRATALSRGLIRRFADQGLSGVDGALYMLAFQISLGARRFVEAEAYLKKAYSSYLAEHNWYHHLYALMGFARLSRMQRQYSQAYFYLDLIDRATAHSPAFRMLKEGTRAEREALEKDAVDLLIDLKKGQVRTRDSGPVSLRKQFVLLDILRVLSGAKEKGLTKAQLIEKVWGEGYRPEAHDNKLYYNINRLRKLIEPDMKMPKYLQNWKEGYRLGAGLKVQLIGQSDMESKESSHD